MFLWWVLCRVRTGCHMCHHIRDQQSMEWIQVSRRWRSQSWRGLFLWLWITIIRKWYVIIHASNTVILLIYSYKIIFNIYIYMRYVLWLYTCSLSEGSNITFAPSFTAVSTPDVVISGRWWKKKRGDPSNSRTGQPIAAVLAHSHGTAFVMCYTASYIFVSLGGVPAVGLVTEKTSTTRDWPSLQTWVCID